MSVCGYNPKMGAGLRVLFEGMFDAIHEKSVTENVPIRAILRRELVEIPRINTSLAKGRDNPYLSMFLGLNLLALPHFSTVLSEIETDQPDQVKARFMSKVDEFVEILDAVEKHNLDTPQADIRNAAEVGARAERLGAWVLQQYALETVS